MFFFSFFVLACNEVHLSVHYSVLELADPDYTEYAGNGLDRPLLSVAVGRAVLDCFSGRWDLFFLRSDPPYYPLYT